MKSKTTAGLLGILLGEFGIHWFYLGKTYRGLCYLVISIVGIFFMLLPFIIVGIISFIEGIMLLCKDEDTFNYEYNYDYNHQNDKYQQQQQFYQLQQPQKPQYSAPPQHSQPPRLAKSDFSIKADKLKDLKALLDAGVLTQEEFDSEKKKILNS